MTNIDDLIREAREIQNTREAWAEIEWDADDAPTDYERDELSARCEALVDKLAELAPVHVTTEPAPGVKIIDHDGDKWDHDPAYFGGRWVIAKNLKRAKREAIQLGYVSPVGRSGGLSFDRLVEQYGPLTLKES